MNQCADLLLLQLVPKDRIASITYNAHGGAEALFPGADAGIAINHGAAEEIAAEKPDLILAGSFSTPTTRAVARKAGAPLIELQDPSSFDDIRRVVRQAGAAVGEPARAEALIARMDAQLSALAAAKPARPYTIAAWTGDSVPGKRTLANAVIEAAGAVNIAARNDTVTYGSFGVEELVTAQPDVLMVGAHSGAQPTLQELKSRHPMVRKLFAGRTVTYQETALDCGLPQTADAAVRLHADLAAIGRRGAP